MAYSCTWQKPVAGIILCGILALEAVFSSSCATHTKPTLRERLTAMSDDELVAYYQGIDARLRAVREGVRREQAAADDSKHANTFQQTYFFGGDGQRLLHQRQAAERELVRRQIPPGQWAGPLPLD